MDNQIAIDINHISKSFKVFLDKGQSIKERILFRSRSKYEKRIVLKDITLSIKRGEAVGLIGHNGCGKSTLLKMMTRIMYPDSGSIKIDGRISSLIELGAGFHPDMSGRENIYINASIFGLSKSEIDTRVPQIIEFSELEEFIDNPIRTYSSGMYMRLAFAVAINVDADVLLIDEILAVGDTNFQSRCFEKIQALKNEGVTIVIVSHSLEQIQQICDTTYWIDDGLIRESGTPKIVHEKYLSAMESIRLEGIKKEHQRENQKKNDLPSSENSVNGSLAKLPSFCEPGAVRLGNGKVEFVDVKILNAEHRPQYIFSTGEKVVIYSKYTSVISGEESVFGYAIYRDDNVYCYGTNTDIESNSLHILKNSEEMYISFINHLLPGKYYIEIAAHKKDGTWLDDIRHLQSFVVSSSKRDEGICRLETKWEFIC